MQYRVVAIPICNEFCNTNSDGRAQGMAKLDPKLAKKISHSKLIACSTEIGIKNADKISKELLISAFLDAVEKVDAEGKSSSLPPNVVTLYNEIIVVLDLGGTEETPVATEEVPAAAPAPAPAPVVEPPPAPAPTAAPPTVARRVGRPASPAPAPTPAAAPAPTKVAAPTKEKKEKVQRAAPTPKSFNRWTVLADTVLQMKKGTLASLIEESNKAYIALGGKDNAKEASAVAKCGTTLLDKIGAIVVSGDSFTLNE